jgi:hypothetical protein
MAFSYFFPSQSAIEVRALAISYCLSLPLNQKKIRQKILLQMNRLDNIIVASLTEKQIVPMIGICLRLATRLHSILNVLHF